jgi:glycosyltransferase involved in cell wall biosynthesis
MSCRILHIIPSLNWGSAERQLRLVLAGLPANEFQQRVCLLHGRSQDLQPQLAEQVVSLGSSRRWDLHRWRRLAGLFKDFAPNIVHSWREDAWWPSAICRLAGPAVPQVQSHWQNRPLDILALTLDRLALRGSTTRLYPPWFNHAPAFRASQPSRASTLTKQIDYAVEQPASGPAERTVHGRLRDKLSIAPSDKIIGFVGPLVRDSRVKDAIWAGDLLKVVRDDVHLVIAGYGPLRGRLAAFRRQVQIEDRVHFVHKDSDIAQTMDAVDCLWVTGQTDVGVSTVVEGMARGLPVVATNIEAHQRYIDDGQNGILVNVGHRAGFARATLRLFADKSLKKSLGTEAKQAVDTHAAAASVLAHYQRVYRELSSAA